MYHSCRTALGLITDITAKTVHTPLPPPIDYDSVPEPPPPKPRNMPSRPHRPTTKTPVKAENSLGRPSVPSRPSSSNSSSNVTERPESPVSRPSVPRSVHSIEMEYGNQLHVVRHLLYIPVSITFITPIHQTIRPFKRTVFVHVQ